MEKMLLLKVIEDKGVWKGNQFNQTLPCPFKAGGITIMGRSGKRAGTLSSLSVTMVPLRDGKVATAHNRTQPSSNYL